MSRWTAGVLVFAASGAVLVLEILTGRLLAPYVGVSLETFTAIIGVVLAGISVGTWVGGRLADRLDPRSMLGPELVFGGVLTLAAVPLARLLGPASAGGGALVLVILTTVTVFLPAAILSAVPPTVVKIVLRDLRRTGTVVGRLSALGTAGAIAGTFLTGFVLIGAFPTSTILVALGAVLVVGGVAVGPLPRRGIVVAAALAGALAVLAPDPCGLETRYSCAVIREDPADPTGRFLVLDTVDNSYVDLDDPLDLRFTYSRMFASLIEVETDGSLDVVHVGGGGFTMPRWIAAARPGSTSVVLEIDAQVVDLARRRLGLETGPDLRVLTGDARQHFDDLATDSADLVLGDAFSGLTVPWHLTTVEVATEIDRILRPGGMYLMNVIDHGDLGFLRAEAATLRQIFPEVAVVTLPERLEAGGNFVIVGARHPVDGEAVREEADRRGLDVVVVTGSQLDRLIGGAEVLVDDHAPVDQLLDA